MMDVRKVLMETVVGNEALWHAECMCVVFIIIVLNKMRKRSRGINYEERETSHDQIER